MNIIPTICILCLATIGFYLSFTNIQLRRENEKINELNEIENTTIKIQHDLIDFLFSKVKKIEKEEEKDNK